MIRTNKKPLTILVLVLFAATILSVSFADSVWAQGSDGVPGDEKAISLKASGSEEANEGENLHADPATFEKNFCLSVDKKEYAITQIEKVISLYLNSEMSDLQKYYTLAKWANSYVVYDSKFWHDFYDFDYYRHQMDAYGAMKEDEKSVCVGIAIFYANLCHAADLPCKYARNAQECTDHTVNYIPDINGNAYFVDITENHFLMSKEARIFAPEVDLDFSNITKDAEDGTFEYEDQYGLARPSNLKECWQNKVSYKDWFKEYALHEGTDKNKHFWQDYVEKGSGESGKHCASYQDFDKYPAQPYASRTSAVTGIWFLDDFYMEPAKAEASILNRELDEQFIDISGVNGSYDCESVEELVKAVNEDISISYFPSAENGKVVAKAAELTNGEDYTVTYASHDDSTGEEVLAIQGTEQGGDGYKGTCQIRVKMNSAIVKKAPARINGIIYNGSPQNLVEPGEAENGTLFYAVCEPGAEPDDEDYSEAIPAEINPGKYEVWYKVKGEKNHSDTPAQKLERPVKISGIKIDEEDRVTLSGDSFTYNGKVQKPSIKATGLVKGRDYTVSWENPTSKDAGAYEVTITGIGYYSGTVWDIYEINKAANPMKLKAKSVKVKHSKVREKAQTIKRSKVITVKKAKGKRTYELISVKNGKKNFEKKFEINAKTGNITVKKGLKKGTYNVKVKVKAAGNHNYKASARKKVTFKIIVE